MSDPALAAGGIMTEQQQVENGAQRFAALHKPLAHAAFSWCDISHQHRAQEVTSSHSCRSLPSRSVLNSNKPGKKSLNIFLEQRFVLQTGGGTVNPHSEAFQV